MTIKEEVDLKTQKRNLRVVALMIIALIVMSMTVSLGVFAEELDFSDNEVATQYLSENGKYADAEDKESYGAAAATYIDEYSSNVGTDGFDENLSNALDAKRDDVKPFATWLSLLPAIIAIVLALITKEVYSSLFIGILSGALLYANFNFTGTIDHLFVDGFITSVADSYNIGILIFLNRFAK